MSGRADLDDEETPKTSRATIIRRVLVAIVALACAGALLYTRVLVKKGTLGDACTYDMHCKKEAPRCLKQSTDGEGVCSRACDADAGDCADGITCVNVELDDYDERGKPLQGGYCFPQALLDARRKKKTPREAGAPRDSWVDVPSAPGQLEGEIAIERGGATTTVEVKGSLLRVVSGKGRRTVVDTAALRVYAIDDEKKTFAASQIASTAEAQVTKTDRRDRVVDRECDIWRIEETSGGARSAREACVVKGAAFVDPHARAATAWEKELSVRGYFPLRITDEEERQAEAVSHEDGSSSARRFAVRDPEELQEPRRALRPRHGVRKRSLSCSKSTSSRAAWTDSPSSWARSASPR
jgi:hypothetical protein